MRGGGGETLVCPAWALPGGAFGAPPQAGASDGLHACGGSASYGTRGAAQAAGSDHTGASDWAAICACGNLWLVVIRPGLSLALPSLPVTRRRYHLRALRTHIRAVPITVTGTGKVHHWQHGHALAGSR